MPDDNLIVRSVAKSIAASESRQATVTNGGPTTVYYKDQADVSPESNDGSLATGVSKTFSDGPRWFISSGVGTRLFVSYSPEFTTDLATQAELNTETSTRETKDGERVVGPASAVDTDLVVFDGTTGKKVKDSSVLLSSVVIDSNFRTVFMTKHGAEGDGETDDWTAFKAARTAAGSNGIVYFNRVGAGPTTYYFGASTEALTGCYLAADPDVTLDLPASNVAFRTWKLLTPVNTEFREYDTTNTPQVPSVGIDHHVGAAVLPPDYSEIAVADFTTWEERDYTLSTAITYTVGSEDVSSMARELKIESVASGHQAGASLSLSVGQSVAAGIAYGGGATSGGAVYVVVQASADEFVTWAILDPAGAETLERRRRTKASGAWTVERTLTLQSPGYKAGVGVFPYVEVKRSGRREAALVINGLRIDIATFENDIDDVGFYANKALSEGVVTLHDATIKSRAVQAAGGYSNFTINAYGDSITAGTGQVVNWQDFLVWMLRGQPGVEGDVVVTTKAEGGYTAKQVYDSFVSKDAFTTLATPYALVQVGTNDIRLQTAIVTFIEQIELIGNKIAGPGFCTPIFGIPPMQSQPATTGYGTEQAERYKRARYCAALAYICADKGWLLADLAAEMGGIGANNRTLMDNTHPTMLGSLAIARAFAKVVVKHRRELIVPEFASVDTQDITVTDDLTVGGAAAITGKLTAKGEVEIDGDLNHDSTKVGLFGTAPETQQTVKKEALTADELAAALAKNGYIKLEA